MRALRSVPPCERKRARLRVVIFSMKTMKTMMELLISLQRAEHSLQLARRRRQLTPLEDQHGEFYLNLVREIIPEAVLVHYDQMKTTAAELLESPELFSMAVLVATYGSLSPCKRQRLLKHFATPPRLAHSRPHAKTSALQLGQRARSAPRPRACIRPLCRTVRPRGPQFGLMRYLDVLSTSVSRDLVCHCLAGFGSETGATASSSSTR